LALLYVYGVAYKAFFTSLREPLRAGAPSVPDQAAQLHHPPLNYFLLSSLCKGALRAEPQALRSKGSFLTTSLRFLSFFSSLSLIVCVASPRQKKERKRQ